MERRLRRKKKRKKGEAKREREKKKEREKGSRSVTASQPPYERWGPGVEYHFQKN